MKLKGLICALALAASLGACDLFTGPDGPTGSVSLSFMVPGTGAAASAARLFGAAGVTLTDGAGNTAHQLFLIVHARNILTVLGPGQ